MHRTFRDARTLHAAAALLCLAASAHAQSGRRPAADANPSTANTPAVNATTADPATVATPATTAGQTTQSAPATAGRSDPYDALRRARTVFVRSKSAFFNPRSLEQALVNREEFQDWEMAVTRDEADADLVIEVSRKAFTNRFVYNVIDARANRVLAGGRIGSLGGTVEGQIADSFMKKMRRARAARRD